MLKERLLVSCVLIPSLVGLFAWDHSLGGTAPVLLVLVGLLAVRLAFELVQLLHLRELKASWPLSGLATAVLVVAGWSSEFWGQICECLADGRPLERVALTLAVVMLVLLLVHALRFREPGASLGGLGADALVIVYTGLLLIVTAQLRWTPGPELGYLALGSLVAAAKMGDTGAYTLGRLFGRKKLHPRLSPGKTWMGAWGAVLGASLGAVLWLEFGQSLFSAASTGIGSEHSSGLPLWLWAAIYGAVIGVAGLIGDLCESLMKRDAEVKDSATLLPGMGGALDLLDSILYAGPIAYLFWTLWPPTL
jgi:phosphatidate cytidylyltransferase